MGIVNRIAVMITSRMSKEDKKKLMDEVVARFFNDMTSEEKRALLDNWMDKFFADMTTEDKQKIVENTMPRIRDGFSTAMIIPQMLSAMMGMGQQNNDLSSLTPTMVSSEQ